MATTFSRRSVLLAGFGLLTALSGTVLIRSAADKDEPRQSPTDAATSDGVSAGRNFRGGEKSPAGFAVSLADIPVGGGVIYLSQQTVVTQQEGGTFAVLHTQCPHDNCDVGDVRNGQIICFCHGSRFTLTGGPKRGPARKGLARRQYVISGDVLYVTDVPAKPAAHSGSGACTGCDCFLSVPRQMTGPSGQPGYR